MELTEWDVVAVGAKALTYAATLGAAGAIFFLTYCGALLQEPPRARIRRLIAALLIVSAVASCAKILLTTAAMSGDLAGMFDLSFTRMILGAGEGVATGVRLVGLALAAVALRLGTRFRALVLVGAALMSMSFAGIGHIHALWPSIAPSLLLGLHLLCAAFWLGALAPLLIAARDLESAQIAAVAARFGQWAVGVVALLLCAGAGLLWTLIGTAPFWSSDYGRIMAAKLLLVAVLLGIAGANKLYLTPRLLQGYPKALLQFRRTVQMEIIIGALILLFTAAFTTLTGPPPA